MTKGNKPPLHGDTQRFNRKAIDELSGSEVVQGKLVTAKLTTGTTLVTHGLGRPWKGWKVVDIDAHATVKRDSASTADRTLYLPLIASAPANVTLWVF